MNTLILTHADVEQLLPMDECIGVMTDALAALARGQVHQPLRMMIRPPDAAGLMGLMPAYRSGERAAFGLKAICVFPGNTARGLDAHQGAVMLLSAETGELLALLNASAVTAIRTAAVSAVATNAMARQDATDLAIVGAGVQARWHLAAMAAVRPIRRVRVASRDVEHARALAAEMGFHVLAPIDAVDSVERAVEGADIVVTATTAIEPVLRREWIAPGVHINAVGSSTPTAREIDTATIAAASLFVDWRESTLNEAGDVLLAAREGAIGLEHIKAEIGEVLIGAKPSRTSDDEITLFKSVGLAVEDLAAAEHVYRKAKEFGVGTWVEF
jgi:ornithine cyclodeaminase